MTHLNKSSISFVTLGLTVYIVLAVLAGKTYKWTSEWSKKIRHGSPIEGRCYYNFENQDGTNIEYNLPCSIIPDIDIDIKTKTVTRAKVFRESNTRFNIAKADPSNIKKWELNIGLLPHAETNHLNVPSLRRGHSF